MSGSQNFHRKINTLVLAKSFEERVCPIVLSEDMPKTDRQRPEDLSMEDFTQEMKYYIDSCTCLIVDAITRQLQ